MTRFRCAFVLLLAAAFSLGAQTHSPLRYIYARQACSIMKEKDGLEIATLAKKGEALAVMRPAPCFVDENTVVTQYKVRCPDGSVGYVSAEYLTFDKEEASKRYEAEKYDPLHRAAKNTFNGGDPLGCDYYPRTKPVFEGRQMPASCYCLYVTCSRPLLEKIDEYIRFAKTTKVNAFVIDIKEDGAPGFKADAMKKFSPSAYNRAGDNEGLYREVVRKIHQAGMWAIGRIVTFKDFHFTKDHPECALWDTANNCMLLHNKSNWPSAYSRKVWEYNVALACEAVEKFGFDEINFDYVRFPDRMNRIEHSIQMRNLYGESKVQAIQRFVTYAADELHKRGAYISVDVFGEAANPGYTTAYGQYWPAISNVVDVICGMPYPDHFSNGYYGINKPWNHPYDILHAWGTRAQARQDETPSPAKVRTWVQTWRVMRHVDRYGIDYDAAAVEKEIRGLYESGCRDGYLTWLASCNLERYRTQAPAYSIDYLKEYSGR